MKTKLLLFLALALFLQISSSCRSKRVVIVRQPAPAKVKTLPPGQAKKITGSQSAKPYAPGQQKKKY